jgi:ubiquitin-like protein Pup
MSKQTTTRRAEANAKTAEPAGDVRASLAKRGKAIDEAVDKLLDEIDDVLEENAEEFVKGYVQRGGE